MKTPNGDVSRWDAFTDSELSALICAYASAIGEAAADDESALWLEMLDEGIRRALHVTMYGGLMDLTVWRAASARTRPESAG